MSLRLSRYGTFIVVVAQVLSLGAMAPAMAQDKMASAATAARCDKLRSALGQYDFEKGSQHLSGRRLRADVALALCAKGDYEQGVAILEQVAREAGLSI